MHSAFLLNDRRINGRRASVARVVAVGLLPACLAACSNTGPEPKPAGGAAPPAAASTPAADETKGGGDGATPADSSPAPTAQATGPASDAPAGETSTGATATGGVDAKLSAPDKEGWVSLFDGKTLEGWTSTKFGGEGDVEVQDGALILTQGNDLTGVTTTRKDLPTSNYEIAWEAKRVQGNDFFGSLTFPVKEDPCTLVLGGWGGTTVGLSSLNGFDASENESSSAQEFENDRWYKIRLRVTDAKIEAWIDDKQIVDLDLEGKRISVRIEVELSRPLGFSTWRTTGALRNIRLKRLESK